MSKLTPPAADTSIPNGRNGSALIDSEEQLATKKEFAEIKSVLKVLKWMLGIVIVVTVVPALKALFIP